MFDVYILMFMSAILIYLAINYKFNKQEFDKQITNSSKNKISNEYLTKIKKELFKTFDDDYLNQINEKKNKKLNDYFLDLKQPLSNIKTQLNKIK
jgi:hypothetical protein